MRQTSGSSAAATRRRRQAARTRQDILEAATRVFARGGFRAATMQQIAREAGYTAASLYTYFLSKEAIFDGLTKMLTEEVLATFAEPTPAGLTLAGRLELLLGRQLELAERRKDALVVFFSLRSGGDYLRPASRRGPRVRGLDLYTNRLAEWLRETARAEDFGGRNASDLACALAGISYGFFLRWLREAAPRAPAERARSIVGLFLHGARGPAPRRGDPS